MALRRLRIRRLGMLHGIREKTFHVLSTNQGASLVNELHEIIQAAADGRLQLPLSTRAGAKPGSQDASLDRADVIFIPQSSRGLSIIHFPMSVRLSNVLLNQEFRVYGDIHGFRYDAFLGFRNCGKTTIRELRGIVLRIQSESPDAELPPSEVAPIEDGLIRVAPRARMLRLVDLPLSARLENALRAHGLASLNDLDRFAVTDVMGWKNFGRRSLGELKLLLERAAKGEFEIPGLDTAKWKPCHLLAQLQVLLVSIRPRDRALVLRRLGAKPGSLATLEEIGGEFNLTRERVRQVVAKSERTILRAGGPRFKAQLRQLSSLLSEMVCPLTPALVDSWRAEASVTFDYTSVLFVRLIGGLSADISSWPDGQEPSSSLDEHSNRIAKAVEALLYNGQRSLVFRECFEKVKVHGRMPNLQAGEFLEALKRSKALNVCLDKPEAPEVRLKRLPVAYVARWVLQDSSEPLLPEDILARAQARFGADLTSWSARGLANCLDPKHGFYLLKPRAYGLRKHFRLPETEHAKLRADFARLLSKANHPLSSVDFLENGGACWNEKTSAYEAAQILREDARFMDLGKFLFALASWGMEERTYVKDLILQILETAGHPMTRGAIVERLQRFRSASPTTVQTAVKSCPMLHHYGFGYVGMKCWGSRARSYLVSHPPYVGRAIHRSDPPLRFSHLCELMGIDVAGPLASKLWQTVETLSEVQVCPAERNPTATIVSDSCSLERALVGVAKQEGRPLPAYELQWKLNDYFGSLFSERSAAEVQRCLEQSSFFVRNAQHDFMLNTHLEQLGLDEEGIHESCLQVLSQSGELMSCEDLIEQLEAAGKVWEHLSADILASLLRGSDAFQEIGKNRFRVTPCQT